MMLKKLPLSLLFVLILAFHAKAQKTYKEVSDSLKFVYQVPTQNIIKSNIYTPIFSDIILASEFRLGFETKVANSQAVQVDLSYLGTGLLFNALINNPLGTGQQKFFLRGSRVQLQYRFYVNELVNKVNSSYPEGLYFAPLFTYSSAKIASKTSLANSSYIRMVKSALLLNLGYQFKEKLFDVFLVDVFVGAGYKNNYIFEYNAGTINYLNDFFVPMYYNNYKITMGFNLGIPLN